jgi:hypothetical protein
MVCECMYLGELLTRMLYVSKSLNRKIVLRVEPSFYYTQKSAEIVPVQLLLITNTTGRFIINNNSVCALKPLVSLVEVKILYLVSICRCSSTPKTEESPSYLVQTLTDLLKTWCIRWLNDLFSSIFTQVSHDRGMETWCTSVSYPQCVFCGKKLPEVWIVRCRMSHGPQHWKNHNWEKNGTCCRLEIVQTILWTLL